jgi:sterol desaturase/sphingolipid hydroxylase (fatty acid hydroxylase superfamily)
MNSTHTTVLEGSIDEDSVVACFWKSLCSNYPPGLLEALLLFATQVIFFWVPATALLLLDLNFPQFSNSHKIQSERRQPTWQQIKHCIKHVALNTTNGTLIQFGIAYYLGFQKSIFKVSPDLPSGKELAFDLTFAMVVREIMFYYLHRGFHHPSIYKFIHK